MPPESLFQRLKDRKLVQWGIAYFAGAWVLVEATNLVVEQFSWPQAVGQAVTILAFFGFFVVLVIAWYHGEKGRQWVSGPELLIIALLLLISGGVLSIIRPQEGGDSGKWGVVPNREGDDRPSIAVLPCDNISPNPEDVFFAEGIHEEILLRLQRISSLFSIGRTSVLQYGENPPPVTDIASALRVGYVGECSVRKQENQIRLTFQLLDGSTGGQLWAEIYDTTLTAENLFEIQGDIAQQIAQAMRAVLSPEERARIETRPTESMEAYNAYLLGRFWWNQRTPEALQRALVHFQDAINLDPEFALAYVGLADSYMVAPWYGEFISANEAHLKGLEAAHQALGIDDRMGEAHASLAAVKLYLEWDWEGARGGFQRAIELSPRYAMAHQWYGLLLLYTGQFAESEERLRFALNLDPLYPNIHLNVGDVMAVSGRKDEAIEHLERSLELFPGFVPVREALARNYMNVGRFTEALELIPDNGYSTYALRALGREREALALAERLEEEGSLQERIRARAGIADVDGAFAILERALAARASWSLAEPNIYSYYESLHSDPRWADYLRRIGVEDYR